MVIAAFILAVIGLVFAVLALNGKVNNAVPMILISIAVMLLSWGGFAGAVGR